MDAKTETSYWPRGVLDPLCPSEHVITESMDRRVLWHLENQLAVSATTDYLRDIQRNLAKYLNTTCEHHWHNDVGYEDHPPLRQCLWCNDVEHDCGHVCCDERSDPQHDHFLRPGDCPKCAVRHEETP